MIRPCRIGSLFLASAICILSTRPVLAVPVEYQPNYDKGFGRGYEIGYESGFASGKERGFTEGTANGQGDGFRIGWDDAYQPAFDRAYDINFPIGHAAGWNPGVVAGFEEGFRWAETNVGGLVLSYYDGSFNGDGAGAVLWGPRSPGGPSGFGSSSGSITITSAGGPYDWAAHYFGVGYKDGHAEGLSIGSEAGYDLAYPRAYAAAYRVGHRRGTAEGTREGLHDGEVEGFAYGWDSGYDDGFGPGYDAGVDYYLFGDFVAPTYPLAHMSLRTTSLSIPEPTSFALLGMSGMFGLLRRASRRKYSLYKRRQ